MRTDTIFYKLFKTLPSLLFELLGESPEKSLNYEFTSAELKEISKRIDGLFIPTNSPSKNPIYFVEVQFQKDDKFYDRFFTETSLYLGQYQPESEWLMIAIWAKKSLNDGIPLRYQVLERAGVLHLIYLEDLKEIGSLGMSIMQLVIAKPTKVTQPLELVKQQTQAIDNNTLQRDIIELVDQILIYKFPAYSRKELEKMFSLTDWKKTRFYQEVSEESKLEGQLEEKLKTVSRLLKKGFKPQEIAEITELSLERVQQEIKKISNLN
jgi:predicted transposase/invertase (TIGR01784 family)